MILGEESNRTLDHKVFELLLICACSLYRVAQKSKPLSLIIIKSNKSY